MSDGANREVCVRLRHTTLTEAAAVEQRKGSSVFITLANPPPVGSVLQLVESGAEPSAVEVTRVVEVESTDDPDRGVLAAPVDDDVIDTRWKVGTEHLEDGVRKPAAPEPEPEPETQPQPDPDRSEPQAQSDEAPQFDPDSMAGHAMPAPVIEPEPSEPIQVADGGSDDGGDGATDDPGPRGKRRRGRKRK